MQFESPLTEGVLIKRYKRFLADVKLEDGTVVTAHTPNTGAMTGCCEPGSRVWLSRRDNPRRTYPLGWELVEAGNGVLVGINTGIANTLVMEGLRDGTLAGFDGYRNLRREMKFGLENSRVDFLLEDRSGTACYIEVKNVTLVEKNIAYFPDAVSKRGSIYGNWNTWRQRETGGSSSIACNEAMHGKSGPPPVLIPNMPKPCAPQSSPAWKPWPSGQR